MKDKDFYICNCKGHSLELDAWIHEEYPELSDISLVFWYSSGFDRETVWQRLKTLFSYLTGRKVLLEEIILDKEKARRLGETLLRKVQELERLEQEGKHENSCSE